jgi:hypothetical protein
VQPDEGDARTEYRAAYEDWQKQLEGLHKVLLDGELPSSPDRMKGLLNREVRAFQRFTEARRRLLGIPDEEGSEPELNF